MRGTTRPLGLAFKESSSRAGVPVDAVRFYGGKYGSYWLMKLRGLTAATTVNVRLLSASVNSSMQLCGVCRITESSTG